MITLHNIDGRSSVVELHRFLFDSDNGYSKLFVHSASEGRGKVGHVVYNDPAEAQVRKIDISVDLIPL